MKLVRTAKPQMGHTFQFGFANFLQLGLLCACFCAINFNAQAQIITTIAGGGVGDGGPATAACMYTCGVAVDGAGNIYIADQGNNRIRKVTSGGIVSTVAGNGNRTFVGDGGPATAAS